MISVTLHPGKNLGANDDGSCDGVREDRTSLLRCRCYRFLILRIHKPVWVHDRLDGRIVRPCGDVST